MDANTAPAASLAERKRQLMRDELTDAAVKLLATQGFEETTVDQIAAAVGMSRRTFSRYFDSKEDVLVHMLAEAGTALYGELRARPDDEPLPAAMRHALTTLTCLGVENPGKTLLVSRLILNTPALLARYLERQSQWQQDMTAILAERAGLDPATDLRPTLAAGTALTAFNAALRRWVDSEGTLNLDEVVDQAFAIIAPVIASAAA